MAIILATALNAAATTGPGPTCDVESTQSLQHTMITTVTGTVQLVEIDLQVSHDNSTWATVATQTVTGNDPQQLTVYVTGRYLCAYLRTLNGDPGVTVTSTISSG